MNGLVKKIARRTMPSLLLRFQAYNRLVAINESYLHTSGWMESLRRGYPCDSSGHNLPWMNFSAIAIICDRLTKNLHVFEYGSGYSTVFYASVAKSVRSIEHDETWMAKTVDELPDNASIRLVPLDTDGDYCRAINMESPSPDFVVIDGRDRVNCLKQSLACCHDHTVILLDDTHRERYQPGLDHARESGYRVLNIEGLKPGGLELNRSSLIYRDGNCFGL